MIFIEQPPVLALERGETWVEAVAMHGDPKTPGRTLVDDYLKPLRISLPVLAEALKVEPFRLGNLMIYQDRLDVDLALRLSRYFGTTPDFWLDLRIAHIQANMRHMKLAQIEAEVTPHESACKAAE
nr:HigA family addiction module antitoxin [uncultured Lichenicoccus sp.]